MAFPAYRTTQGARKEFVSTALYFSVARLMVEAHQIPPELALYHASRMDEPELLRRLRLYAEMELSVAGPTPRAVNELSTRFSRPQRRRQADGTQPCSRDSWGAE